MTVIILFTVKSIGIVIITGTVIGVYSWRKGLLHGIYAARSGFSAPSVIRSNYHP